MIQPATPNRPRMTCAGSELVILQVDNHYWPERMRVAAVVGETLYPYADWFPVFWLTDMGWRLVLTEKPEAANV